MSVSALSGVFREYTLTYEVASGTSMDADGNPIETTTNATLIINFEPTSAPQIIFREGADPKVVRGTAYCVNPSELPATLGPGSTLTMTFEGRPGTLTILSTLVDPLAVLDEVLGQEFACEWRAT